MTTLFSFCLYQVCQSVLVLSICLSVRLLKSMVMSLRAISRNNIINHLLLSQSQPSHCFIFYFVQNHKKQHKKDWISSFFSILLFRYSTHSNSLANTAQHSTTQHNTALHPYIRKNKKNGPQKIRREGTNPDRTWSRPK